MSILLTVSHFCLPRPVRRKKLIELFESTAEAFRCPVPDFSGLSSDRILTRYALFTKEKAEESIRQGREEEVRSRLFEASFRIGSNLRKQLHIQSVPDVMQACRVVYKALHIDFHGDAAGCIEIPHCFFSGYYTASTCRVIAGLDEGLVAGLSGGLQLEFSRRITEGCPSCQACLRNGGREK